MRTKQQTVLQSIETTTRFIKSRPISFPVLECCIKNGVTDPILMDLLIREKELVSKLGGVMEVLNSFIQDNDQSVLDSLKKPLIETTLQLYETWHKISRL